MKRCGFGITAAICMALALAAHPVLAGAATFGTRFSQAEQRDPSGRVTVEAATIYTFSCNGAGENGGSYYLYGYVNRSGWRAILPPNWGRAIGGRDFPTWQQAVAAACSSGTSAPGPSQGRAPAPNGNWTIAINGCGYLSPQLTGALTQSSDGAISGQLLGRFDQAQKADVIPDQSHGAGGTVKIVAHPDGWVSNLEFTGTWDGSKFAGPLHHYGNDDCTFTMSRR